MMKYNIFCLILVLGVIFSVSSVCATDLNETQVIPTDDSIQITNEEPVICESPDDSIELPSEEPVTWESPDDSIELPSEEPVTWESPDDSIELPSEDIDMYDDYDNFTPIYKGGPFELPSDEIDMENLSIEKNLDKDQNYERVEYSINFMNPFIVKLVPMPKFCPLTIVLRDWDGSKSHKSNISLRIRKEIRDNNTIRYENMSEKSVLTNKKGEAKFLIITEHNVTTMNFQVIISFHDCDCKYIISGKILDATKGGEIWVSFPSDKNGRQLIDKKEGVDISMYGQY